MQIELSAADRLPLSRLAELWNQAFGDYYVPMRQSIAQFDSLLRRELISLPDSLVAMVEGQPVGLALAGLRWSGDACEAYDAGTGVIPTYRGKGIASQLMQALMARMADVGASKVSLTAVSRNQIAIRLYQREGFAVKRQLTCYEFQANAWSWLRQSKAEALQTSPVPVARVLPMSDLCYRQPPEWQNRPQGLKLLQARAILASRQGDAVGYAVYAGQDPVHLYQLGVLPEWRRRGIGATIWRAVLRESGARRSVYLNHPEEELEGTAWLGRHGFRAFLEQVEMQKELNMGQRSR
jgi:ribosomal protein S18 acetylase RimI-like enzyme